MDNLFKQIRVRFSDLGEDQQYNIGEGRKAPEKTVAYNEERKRTQNWFGRQLSSKMDDASDIELATAVAAAAYAISLLEESFNQRKPIEQLTKRTSKVKSKREDSMNKPTDYSRLTSWLTGKEQKEDEKQSGGSSMRKPEPNQSGYAPTLSGKSRETNLTIKRIPTFTDKYLNDANNTRPEGGKSNKGQQTPSMTKPTASISKRGNEGRTIASTKMETEVDKWERTKTERIRQRYEKVKINIQKWENKKKLKAKRHHDRIQRNLELKRANASQEHLYELSTIDQIARGAQALAEERRRNDESKTSAKAKKMRLTGRVPRACFCF